MWFRSIYLRTLRDHRVAIFGWGIAMGLALVSTMASVSILISTPEARAELVGLAQSFSWNAEAIAVDTVGGYATFKIGIFIFLVAVWPLVTGSRVLRGEEERGSMDVLLSTPRGRVRVALEKLAAMWTALVAMGVLVGLIAYAGGQRFGADFTLADALGYGLDLALACAVVGGLALFVSQFTREGSAAAGWTGGLFLLFVVLDMVHRIYPGTEWISRLSPIYYYNLSKPLIPSYGTSAGGMLVQLAIALVLSGAAVRLFVRRDVGATVALPAVIRPHEAAAQRGAALPVNDWSLRSVYARSLGMVAMPAFWWTVAIAGFAGWMIVVVKQIESQLATLFATSSFMTVIIERAGGGPIAANATFLSALFQILPILLMAFAVTQVNGWAADEEDGRLEMVLATPQSRLQVILGRFAALSTATVAIGVLTLGATALTAQVAGLALDEGNLAAATLGMIPLGLLIGALGYLAGGWLRTAADTGLLSFILVSWFFISFVGADLNWPDTALRLSPLFYYGTPLLHGLPLVNVAGLLAVGVIALVMASVRFLRKDIGV